MADENTRPDAGADPNAEEASGQPDYSRKHPLERRWTLWFDAQSKKNAGNWGDSLAPVCSFSTVEEFWCLYNNILTPGKIEPKADLYLFVEGIKPDWDDKDTAAGGAWTASVPRGSRQSKEVLDGWWHDSILHLIGEQYTDGEDICGMAVNIRKQGDRLSMWTKTASNEAIQISLGKQLKEVLKLDATTTIGFVSHEQAKKESKSNQKDTYTV